MLDYNRFAGRYLPQRGGLVVQNYSEGWESRGWKLNTYCLLIDVRESKSLYPGQLRRSASGRLTPHCSRDGDSLQMLLYRPSADAESIGVVGIGAIFCKIVQHFVFPSRQHRFIHLHSSPCGHDREIASPVQQSALTPQGGRH